MEVLLSEDVIGGTSVGVGADSFSQNTRRDGGP